jgi:hypothetical protein
MNKRRNVILAILLVLLLFLAVGLLYHYLGTGGTIKASVGEWTNKDFNTAGITRVQIRRDGSRLIAHMWGRCTPVECDWGEAEAMQTDKALRLKWDQKFCVRTQELTLLNDGSLQVAEHSHFTDNSGREDYDSTAIFAKGLVHNWSDQSPK